VYRIPFAIQLPAVPPELVSRRRFALPQKAFVFLYAFDFHSYLARKNPMAILEAFRRAFGSRRDVVLALKTTHGDQVPASFAELVAACQGQDNIRILEQVLPREDMLALLQVCDAYVSLHRSEGFGLPLAEAMAAGKPVVATGYSSNVDFMTEANSLPVRYRRIAIDSDYGPYRRGAEWADPDVEHAAEQMRRLVDTPELAAQLGAKARADVERTLRPEVVGRLVQQRLSAIMAGLQSLRRSA
jgi:glycosyltransferase involved in cell wall biosynthesis